MAKAWHGINKPCLKLTATTITDQKTHPKAITGPARFELPSCHWEKNRQKKLYDCLCFVVR